MAAGSARSGFKTIADFCKDNVLALRKVCARFVVLCRQIGFLATATRMLHGVILPATLPAVAAGLRTATQPLPRRRSAVGVIAVSSGIGYYLVEMQYAMRPDPMYAAVFYLALTGYALNRRFLALEARLIPWMGKS